MQVLLTFAARLKRDYLLQIVLALALALAVFDPRPADEYLHWLDLPTLAGLTGLLILAQGVRESGQIQRWALHLVAKLHSVRALAFVLVLLSAALSMVLTNDVALFLVVPLTLAIDRVTRVPRQQLVIFEALAVNAGSTLSPIGNPQNLLLWQHSGLSVWAFTLALLSTGAILLGTLLVMCRFAFSAESIHLEKQVVDPPLVDRYLLIGATALLVAMVAALQWGYAIPSSLFVLAIGVMAYRRVLAGVDWLLLVTFAAMFVSLGHLAALPIGHSIVAALDWRDPRVVYAGGVVLSQMISNVPAAVLLQHYTSHLTLLAVAVNVGGSGLAIGSLANLIALRLDGSRGIGWHFHRYSIPYLVVTAALAVLLILM